MKKLCFLFLALFATANSYSQTYTITFAATGAATTVDSVKVENLTHVATSKWHAGDVLQLQLTNGINEMDVTDQNLQVFPNPMQGQAEISFYAKQAGDARLSIYDIAGKEVLQTENKLLQGIQKYELAGLKQGIYFINISGNGYFYTAKLISQNATIGEAKIKYIASEKPEVALTTLKSTKATITMPYTTGDNLRFTGYAGNHSAIVNDVPTGTKTITFTFLATICPPTVSDIDGNIYNTVSIGTQCWMGKNLTTTHYRNGNTIPFVIYPTTWETLTTGAYCENLYLTNFWTIYGRLYNFYAVADTRNLCPTGWHVPTDAEWTILTTYLGGEYVAGGKLKEAGLAHWDSPNTGATNETGFSAFAGGYRLYDGTFCGGGGDAGYWWSATEDGASNAWYRVMGYGNNEVYRNDGDKGNGYSVRCVRD